MLSGCLLTAPGVEYTGTVQMTINGRHCLQWDLSSGQLSTFFPDGSSRLAQNFCRNPSNPPNPNGVWCYTTDPNVTYELCDVPQCREYNISTVQISIFAIIMLTYAFTIVDNNVVCGVTLATSSTGCSWMAILVSCSKGGRNLCLDG